MKILVTFINPHRDMVHVYRGHRPGYDVAGETIAMYPDALACGAFSDDGELLGSVHRICDGCLTTLFERALV